MNFFITNPNPIRETKVVCSIPITPPREHCKNHSMATSKSPLRRNNSRSACTTSSTVLTFHSSPSNSFEEPRTPAQLHYYDDEDDDNESCEASGVCLGGWILNAFFSPSRAPKSDAFSPASDELHQQSVAHTEEVVHAISSSKLKLDFDDDATDRLSCTSASCPSQASSNSCQSVNETHRSMLRLLEDILSMASKSEKECNVNSAIGHLENYLYQFQSLSQYTTPVFELKKAYVLHKLGCLQWQRGQYQLSLHALVEAYTIYNRLSEDCRFSNTSSDVMEMSNLVLACSNVLISLGRLHLSRGNGSAAMQCYHECVERLSSIQRRCDRSQSARIFSQACCGAGRVLFAQGRLASSLKRFKRALKVQLGYEVSCDAIADLSLSSACVPLSDIAETLSHLGKLYEEQNLFDLAMHCYTKSLQIYSISLGPNHVDIGEISLKLGRILRSIGRYCEADQAIRRAHQIFVNNLGEYHRNTLAALLNLGLLYASRGKHKRAQTIYHQVLHDQQATFNGEAHADLALTCHCIALSYEGSFKLDKAMKYYNEELLILQASLHPYHLDIAKLLHHMAMLTMNVVDNDGSYLMLNESIERLEEATEIYEHHNASNAFHRELTYLKSSIQRLYRRQNRQVTQY